VRKLVLRVLKLLLLSLLCLLYCFVQPFDISTRELYLAIIPLLRFPKDLFEPQQSLIRCLQFILKLLVLELLPGFNRCELIRVLLLPLLNLTFQLLEFRTALPLPGAEARRRLVNRNAGALQALVPGCRDVGDLRIEEFDLRLQLRLLLLPLQPLLLGSRSRYQIVRLPFEPLPRQLRPKGGDFGLFLRPVDFGSSFCGPLLFAKSVGETVLQLLDFAGLVFHERFLGRQLLFLEGGQLGVDFYLLFVKFDLEAFELGLISDGSLFDVRLKGGEIALGTLDLVVNVADLGWQPL
jgi:hypothetical protein